MTAPRIHELSIFADYFQLYVQDKGTTEDFASGWTDETVEAMFVSKPTALAIGTARNMDVPVRLEIHPGPADAPQGWDRSNQAVIDLRSGQVQLVGCIGYDDNAPVFDLEPGRYEARVFYFNLDSLSEDGLDGDDRYLIQLWPAPFPQQS